MTMKILKKAKGITNSMGISIRPLEPHILGDGNHHITVPFVLRLFSCDKDGWRVVGVSSQTYIKEGRGTTKIIFMYNTREPFRRAASISTSPPLQLH
jgi:hypothetical protein